MSRSEIEYLHHIKDEAEYLEQINENVSKEVFLMDDTRKRASVRSI